MVSFSKFITSQRGGQILFDTDGYLYTLKHKQKTRNTYLCRSHGRKKKSGESATDPQPCPAKLFFYSESEIHLETSHNHEPKTGEPEALDNKTGIKGKAEEQPLTPTQTIITEALSQSSGSDHLLPKWQSLQSIVKRARRCPEPSPCHHKSHRVDYILPEEATTTVDDQNFLIHDEPGSESRRLGTGNSKTGTLTPCVMRSSTFGRVVLPDFWASCKSIGLS